MSAQVCSTAISALRVHREYSDCTAAIGWTACALRRVAADTVLGRVAQQVLPHLGHQVGVTLGRRQDVDMEFHPPVGARQWVEDGAVEDERAPHLARTAQRVVQRRMVVDPQVAPQPHQGSIQALAHGAECAPVAATCVRG